MAETYCLLNITYLPMVYLHVEKKNIPKTDLIFFVRLRKWPKSGLTLVITYLPTYFTRPFLFSFFQAWLLLFGHFRMGHFRRFSKYHTFSPPKFSMCVTWHPIMKNSLLVFWISLPIFSLSGFRSCPNFHTKKTVHVGNWHVCLVQH